MKKKTVFTSLLVIVVCLCLIVGSTFALFTSDTELNIVANAGKVEMVASLSDLTLYSVEADENGAEVDENGHTYTYVAQTDKFANGGTAVFENGVLTMTNVTPGDKVTFTISGANNSTVDIVHRFSITCGEDKTLMSGLVVSMSTGEDADGDGAVDVDVHPALDRYVSAWTKLEGGADMKDVEISIELPVAKGNWYQEKSASIQILIEAVQANGVVEGDALVEYIATPTTAEELKAAIEDPDVTYVTIPESIEGIVEVGTDVANKTIDANGNRIALKFTGKVEDVVVTNIVDTVGGDRGVDVSAAKEGNITITNCTLTDVKGGTYGAIGVGANVDVVVDECTLIASGDKNYGIYGTSCGKLVVTNSTFVGFESWAIQVNGDINGYATVTGCTFDNCVEGVFKAGVKGDSTTTGTVEGTFTFSDNTLIQCTGHDGVEAKLFGGNLATNLIAEGNIRDGSAWTPDALCGFGK